MYDFFTQIFLAARDNKGKGFVQILVFAVMAIFWIVGGIVKARENKVKDSDFPEEENNAEERSPKPVVHQQVQKFEKGQAAKPVKPAKTEGVIRATRGAKVNSRVEEIVGDFGHVDGLKRAILYSEILGKPVALRKNSESIF